MIVSRTILFYCALILVIRLMGKRQVGQMEPSEFVVTMLLANLASIPMEDLERPVWHGLAAMGLVLLAERMVSRVCLKSIRLRRILCGKPVILIDNGRLLYENLRRTRVNLDELTGHLREQGVLAVEAVQFAILETNGSVTVFPYPPGGKKQALPYTVISDGHIMADNLRLLGKDEAWLRRKLRCRGLQPEQVLLMTLTENGEVAVFPRRFNQI